MTMDSASPGLTAYEVSRRERIRKNIEAMEALNIPSLASRVAPEKKKPAQVTHRGLSTKRKRISENVPLRRSSRVQGIAADGSQVHSERAGEIVIVNGEALLAQEPQGPKDRHPRGTIPFTSSNASPANDEAFLTVLRSSASPLKNHEEKVQSAGFNQFSKFTLREEKNVAKVTKNAITHLQFNPSSSINIIAAADKSGNLGLWNIDHRHDSSTPKKTTTLLLNTEPGFLQLEEEGSFDGILSFQPHYEYVSGLQWRGTHRLFTASYDGSLRLLDVEAGAFPLTFGDEEREYSSLDLDENGNAAFLGDNEGYLDVIDVRSGKKEQAMLDLHVKKVNTVQLDTGGTLLVTGSTDTTIKIWDLRKLAKGSPVATGAHRKTCQSVYWAPDGSKRLSSTSFDDTVKIWDASTGGIDEIASVRHNNQTGRWVLPLRAVWSPLGDGVAVGSMKRGVDLIRTENGAKKVMGVETELTSPWMTAIPSRISFHPATGIIAAATNSGRIHIYN